MKTCVTGDRWRRGIPLHAAAMLLGVTALGQADPAPAKRYTETIRTRAGAEFTLEMVPIPAGSFSMGSPPAEPGRKEHEGPQREVRIKSFYLSTTEIPLGLFQAYYEETGTGKKEGGGDDGESEEVLSPAPALPAGVDAVTGPTPVYGDMTMGFDKNHPAIGMRWNNAATFCKWLSAKTGKKYRLPTEAEWEYAARAGSDRPLGAANGPDDLGDYAWFDDNADRQPHPVGQKKPNAWGLHDMQGNVWEWVQDFYAPDAYARAGGDNPTGPASAERHVARGGCYDSGADELRCATRGFEQDWWSMNDPQIPRSKWWLPQMDVIGFRVACEP